MNVLVTGGAGFIGSNTCVELLRAGYGVVIADDLSNADEVVLDRIFRVSGIKPAFYRINTTDKEQVRQVFAAEAIDAVIHFAAFKAVGESCIKPLEYYRNNLDAAITVLETMAEFGCNIFVFSSSATVYGPNNPIPYVETMPAHTASNPYGWTKIMIEQILRDICTANPNFSAVILRYFNPIGADEAGLLGDSPRGIPNNLMPYITRVASGQLEKLTVFGNDYPTPDGTCRRDYLHVSDLAAGHLKALEYAHSHTGAEAFNLGTGKGVSVLELIHAFEKATGVKVPYVVGQRRAGDLAEFWADATKAEQLLGWRAKKTLEEMCRDSWHFTENEQ